MKSVRKPEAQWADDERKGANLDHRLKSIIMSVLPDNQMNSIINYETAKSTWEDLILYHEGPYDMKENRVMEPSDLKKQGRYGLSMPALHNRPRRNKDQYADKDKHGLFDDQEWPVCNIRRFEMIKYSFRDDEEYVARKENEYDDLASTSKEAIYAYQEIFCIMDEGWMVTCTE
ncbi:hypothetical protein Tco_0243145 [Tanacetum coccineum]